MNMTLFHWINDMAGKNPALDHLMLFLSMKGIYLFAGIPLLMYLWGFYKRQGALRASAINSVVFTGMNLMLAYLIGTVFYIDRPFVHHKAHLLYPHVADASFLSDHATLTMSLAQGTGWFNKGIGILMMLMSLAIGFSRIYVGQHSPFDIIGSYMFVGIAGLFYRAFLYKHVFNLYEKVEKLLMMKLNLKWLQTQNEA